MLRNRNGFTEIQIMVVIIVIGLFSIWAHGKWIEAQDKANIKVLNQVCIKWGTDHPGQPLTKVSILKSYPSTVKEANFHSSNGGSYVATVDWATGKIKVVCNRTD